MNLLDRLARLERAPLLLDGALGTELDRRGVDIGLPLWSAAALLSAPDVIAAIHADHVAAGAEIVTANTFRLHARNLAAAGLEREAPRLTRLAVELARRAGGAQACIAGSQAPLEDCYLPGLVPGDAVLEREHRQMARQLAEAGADLILAETHNTIREAVAATRAARDTGLPVFVSVVCGADGRLLSGESVTDALDAVRALGPAAVLVNCLPADNALATVVELVEAARGLPAGVYANIGRQAPHGGWIETGGTDPAVYAGYAAMWLEAGARIIGGCCGTTPAHIRALRRRLDQREAARGGISSVSE